MTDTIRATPTEKRPTHDFELSTLDGLTKYGLILSDGKGRPITGGQPLPIRQAGSPRTVMQISQGDSAFGGYEMPFTPITQRDWSAGRGQEDFAQGNNKYFDSLNIDAVMGDVILGPKPQSAVYTVAPAVQTNPKTGQAQIPNPIEGAGTEYWLDPLEYLQSQLVATRFFYTLTRNPGLLKLWLAKTHRIGVVIFACPNVDLSDFWKVDKFLNACNGQSDQGYTIVMNQIFDIPWSDALLEYQFNISPTLAQNTYYVIAVQSLDRITTLAANTPPPFTFGTAAPTTLNWEGIQGFYSKNPGHVHPSWDLIDRSLVDSLAFEFTSTDNGPSGAFFFEYRGSWFYVTSPNNGTAPLVFMEGYHGKAGDNNGHLERSIIAGIGQEADGAWIRIISGKGATEETRWRQITDVYAGYVVVSPPWNIAQDATTEYAIVGTGKFTELAGHGMTRPVTAITQADNIMYFAQGEGTPMVAMRINAGAAPEWRPEKGANDATYIKLIQDVHGKKKVWRAKAAGVTASSSDTKAWGTDLDFSGELTCGNTSYRITGVDAYGEPRIPYILKEDAIGNINSGIYDEIPLSELTTVADDRNGYAHMQRGVYLYLSLLNGIERYYDNRLDDVGPNTGAGLPPIRLGRCSSLLSYAGRWLAAYDHPTGYSAIFLNNESGWHEIYRSSEGARIRTIAVQVIPGSTCDKLWIAQTGSILNLDITIDPKMQADYHYSAVGGELITSWFYTGYREYKKFWRSVQLFCESLVADEQYITLQYQVDNDDASDTWHDVKDAGGNWIQVNQTPFQEVMLSPGYTVTGYRLRLKIRLFTTDTLKTPRLQAFTIDAVTRVKPKRSWSLTFLADDVLVDRQGTTQTLPAYQLINAIDAFSDSTQFPQPLKLHSVHKLFDDKIVFTDPLTVMPIEVLVEGSRRQMKSLCTLNFYEV